MKNVFNLFIDKAS